MTMHKQAEGHQRAARQNMQKAKFKISLEAFEDEKETE